MFPKLVFCAVCTLLDINLTDTGPRQAENTKLWNRKQRVYRVYGLG